MKGATIKITKDRADYGVVVADNVASQWNSVMTVTVPLGLAYVLVNRTPFVFYPCTTGTTKFTARNGKLAIGYKGAGDEFVKELYVWDFGTWLDLSIAQMKHSDYREFVALNMASPYVIARESEELHIMLYHTQVCDVSAAGTVMEFNVQKIVLAKS